MPICQRFTFSLLVSVGVSALLFVLLVVTRSKFIFLLQLPGFYASASIWGIHSAPTNEAVGALVFGWVNAIAYWPFVFAFSFLFKRNESL